MKNQSAGPFFVGSLAYAAALLLISIARMGAGDPIAGVKLLGLITVLLLIPVVVITFLPLWLLLGFPLMRWLPARSIFWRLQFRITFGLLVGLLIFHRGVLEAPPHEKPFVVLAILPFVLTFFLLHKTQDCPKALSEDKK